MRTDYGRVEALVRDLGHLLQTGHGADVVFFVGPQRTQFTAHSMVIGARCKVLKRDVRAHLIESRKEDTDLIVKGSNRHPRENLEITLDVDPAAFKAVLRYLYTGKILMGVHNTFEVYRIATRLGTQRLADLVCHHVKRSCTIDAALGLLREALAGKHRLITAVLTEYVAEHCAPVLETDSFAAAGVDVVLHVVEQEELNASEEQIWAALVRRAAKRCGIPPSKTVATMSGLQRQQVVEHVLPFVRPRGLRIMNIPTDVFAREVEPLGVLSTRDALLKYRFEATRDFADFAQAFPAPSIDFIMRIRRRSMVFESAHPHACGVDEKVVVELPSWATKVRIEFDPRCKVAQYAALKFFQDKACTTLLSILTDERQTKINAHKPHLRIEDGLMLVLPSRQFWFKFYSTRNFPPAWGYRFVVYTA